MGQHTGRRGAASALDGGHSHALRTERCALIAKSAIDFAEALPDGGVLLGLDLGTKTIGTALCDAGWRFASAGETLGRGKWSRDRDRLAALITERSVVGIVLGLPRNMDGSEGPPCQATRAFARNLARPTPLPITLWDERPSTVAAERALLEADTSRARRKEVIDHVAAGYILQGVLDRLAHVRQAQ